MRAPLMRLLWLANIPSPYRVDFFNELGKSCQLTVLFKKAGALTGMLRGKTTRLKHHEGLMMRGLSNAADSAICPEVVAHLMRRAYDAQPALHRVKELEN